MACERWKAAASFLFPQPVAPANTRLCVASLRLLTSRSPTSTSSLPEAGGHTENHLTFLHFAYGSNLLKERLRLRNPSAKVHCAARLKATMTGAEQNGLPTDYQEKLRAIKTNAFEAPLPVMAELSKPALRCLTAASGPHCIQPPTASRSAQPAAECIDGSVV